MIPKVQARTFVLPHLPYVIFKAILVANYLYINQKENTFFALQGVPFAFWFCFFFTQKQAALETSHHSPDYYSLTSIFCFVPPLWLKQRQLKCNTNQADIPLPSSSPSPKGEKKKKFDFSSPSPPSAEFDDLSVNINITPLKTSEIQHKRSTQAYCSANPSTEKVLTQHTCSHTKNLQKPLKYFCNISLFHYIGIIWFSELLIPYAICNHFPCFILILSSFIK